MSLDELTDVNNEIIRKGKVFRAARERILSNHNFGPMESDRESLHLSMSNIANEIGSAQRFGKMRFNLDYITAGQESGGFITQVDESATDNDNEFKSILFGPVAGVSRNPISQNNLQRLV